MFRISSTVLLIYLVFLAVIVLTLITVRQWTLNSFATPEAAKHWEEWRERANELANHKRRISDQPPILIWMRNYFGRCMLGALLFGTFLFLMCTIVVRGVFTVPARPMEEYTNDTQP